MQNQARKLQGILGSRLKMNESLASLTTFKIGGPADFFFEAQTSQELIKVIKLARELNLTLTVLGGGSNVLVGDRGVRGLVVKNSTHKITLRAIEGKIRKGQTERHVYVEADSGVIFNQLVRFTIEEGLGGLEMHLGLPGTVGGAIFMNSKWAQSEAAVGDAVYQATLLTVANELKVVPQNYFHFGYDSSIIQKNGEIVISIVFALKGVSKDKLWVNANQSIVYRRQTQPQGEFSAGCIFRNLTRAQALAAATPSQTTSAGFLIDHAGLKGLRVGDAQISTIHANFIINHGSASAADVVKLIETVRQRVKEQYGVELTEEIVRLGEF